MNLLDILLDRPQKPEKSPQKRSPGSRSSGPKGPRTPSKTDAKLGCENCPLNNVRGIHKIMGSVTGKKIMIWAQSPGPDENRHDPPMELVGRAGKWLWKELERIGIDREDCDIQNVQRCFPADVDDSYDDDEGPPHLIMRDPKPEELKCCSIYNKDAMQRSTAKVWLVFGKMAHDQLFGKKKSAKIFNYGSTRVFVLDHPSYFLRGAPQERLDKFREMLDLVKGTLNNESGMQAYLKGLDIKIINTGSAAIKAAKEVLRLSGGGRIAYDEEDDDVDGKRVVLCLGACPKPGVIRVFMLDHPQNPASREEREKVREVVKKLITHPHPKVMHNGSHDDNIFMRLLGVQAQGYHFDTRYADYMSDPVHQSYALDAIVARKFPKYAGYKDIVQEAVPKGLTVQEGRDIGSFRLAQVDIKKVGIYNALDCQMTKLDEMDIKDKVPLPLVRVYTEAAFIADEMEPFGPLFDEPQHTALSELYPKKREWYIQQLRKTGHNPELNPNSPPQLCHLIYDIWKVPSIKIKRKGVEIPIRDTKKETLELLQARKFHPGIKILQDYREANNRVQRMDSFKRSALAHLGRVSTIWWLTGARTGRLSSGGGLRPDKKNYGNLQNIPRDDLVKNMLVSDLRWRDFYQCAIEGLEIRTNSEGKKIYILPNITTAIRMFPDLDWFVATDYSQMELRILAQVTGDPEMCRVFNSGEDIHSAIGAIWTGRSAKEISEDENLRAMVKGLHFGIIYGLSVRGLHQDMVAQGVKVSEKQVEKYYKSYFDKMRLVAQYVKEMPEFAETHGYVENLFGFRVPIDVKPDYAGGSWWKNQAVNAPIQGGAHHVLLMALALIKRSREKYQILKPQMEIHDALICITKIREMERTINTLRPLMEKDAPALAEREFGIKWKIPFVAEAKIGFRFGSMAKVKGSLKSAIEQAVILSMEQDQKLLDELKKYSKISVSS